EEGKTASTLSDPPRERNEMVTATIEWYRTIEDEIARCMAGRGFEYVPHVSQRTIDNVRTQYEEPLVEVQTGTESRFWAPLFPMESSPGSVAMLEERMEKAGETGFGLSFELTPSTAALQPIDNTAEDPNSAIRRSLTEAEADEYWRALQGFAAGDLDGTNEPSGPAIDNACLETARRLAGPMPQVSTPFDGIDTDRLFTIGEEVFRAVHADPRMDAAETERVTCLANHGYPADPYSFIVTLLRSEVESATSSSPGTVEENTGHKEADLARVLGLDRLRQLQAEEIGAASAAIECSFDYSSVERELIAEYEQEALIENPDIASALSQDG
ncbi:MAG: hypothetical protein DWP92_07585, partial [Armatimonadetes bacterium]